MNNSILDVAEDINSADGMTFYRCHLCNKVISKWDIEEHHACPKCGHTKISPTNLSAWEKLIQVCKHPAVWSWVND